MQPGSAGPDAPRDSVIELRDVRKRFGGNVVHDGIHLSVATGEIMTLAGGSGEGKTVLLKEIIGLMRPDDGAVRVFGEEVTTMNEEDLYRIRGNVAMVFQGSALFDSLSVAENVAYGVCERHPYIHKDDLRRIVAEKLNLVDLPGIEDVMPAELSGGMKKRVALARALAIEPGVILYDEPTTGLDPANVRRINGLIVKLCKDMGVTSVMVTHDMASVRKITDRLALLDEGRIIAVGTWDEMERSDDARVRRFLEGDFDE
jgi:phospholipid/cholesterol/gamma-HCH transport system ATP-binding protein